MENFTLRRLIKECRGDMVIERSKAFPSSKTFSIKPIRKLLSQEMTAGIWLDPFARNSDLSDLFIKVITNDLNPNTQAQYHLEAKEFLKIFPDRYADGILFDPPYSARQIKECYNGIGINLIGKGKKATGNNFYWDVIDEISRVVKIGGKVISFGWNSGGMSKKRGFEIQKILLVSHSGRHNDTICVVDKKVKA
jgi:hypothetical protein